MYNTNTRLIKAAFMPEHSACLLEYAIFFRRQELMQM